MNKKIFIIISIFAIALVAVVILKKNPVASIQSSGQEKYRAKEDNLEIEQSSSLDKEKAITREKFTVEELTRTNEEGAVEIDVTFLNPIENDQEFWIFRVAMNTHSVNLDKYNLSELITFTLDGNNQVQNELIVEKKGVGHHIMHYIKVPKEINGQQVIKENINFISIEIKEVDNVALRTFEWDITQFQNLITESGGN